MKKICVIFLVTMLMSSCLTTSSKYGLLEKNTLVESDGAYFFGTFTDRRSTNLLLKDMDSGERYNITFGSSASPQIMRVKPGRYVITGIWNEETYYVEYGDQPGAYDSKTRTEMGEVPADLMTLIEVNEGDAVYLGNFYPKGSGFGFDLVLDFEFKYDFDAAVAALHDTYDLSSDVIVKSVE